MAPRKPIIVDYRTINRTIDQWLYRSGEDHEQRDHPLAGNGVSAAGRRAQPAGRCGPGRRSDGTLGDDPDWPVDVPGER
jgi:hypothetical protein